MAELPPRLLCSTAPFFRQPLRTAFAHIAEAGFTGAEVMVSKDPATQDPGLLIATAREFGLEVGVLHAPFLIFTRRVWGTDPIGKVERAVELAEQTGTPVVVTHPPYRWQHGYRRWIAEELAELSARSGVAVAVENMFPMKRLDLHSAHQIDDLEPFPAITLDTSHAAVAGIDLAETHRRYRDKLVHIHLSNNGGRGWDSHLPVYEGVLPIPEFLDHLAAEDYRGSISLELDLRKYFGDDRALREVLARNREFCGDRLPLLV